MRLAKSISLIKGLREPPLIESGQYRVILTLSLDGYS